MSSDFFAKYMRHAVTIAKDTRYTAYPNPVVGAVLVKDNCIVAQGWHKQYGGPHAEIECLQDAKAKNIGTSNCTLVVTLEPCHHHGKTPPCTAAIVEAGIKHVVIGIRDPNPKAAGGLEFLQSQGIEVTLGIEEELCRDLVADFLVRQDGVRPYVMLKMASTIDGRIATRSGHSQWISCDKSRKKLQTLRANIALCGGVIIIGGGTFRSDNPRLTVHDAAEDMPQPLACVVTSRLPEANIDNYLLKHRPEQTIFFTSPAAAASPRAKALEQLGVRVWTENPSSALKPLPSLKALLERLRSELDCNYALCEGGGKLALSFLEQGLIDEFHLHLNPSVLGDNEAYPIFTGRSPLNMDEALRLRITHYDLCDQDMHITMRLK